MIFLFVHIFAQENLCEGSVYSSYNFGLTPWVNLHANKYLSRQIHEHVKDECFQFVFKSSKNFKSYIKDALDGKYDFLKLPPHLASYLITSYGFKPVTMDDKTAYAIIITLKGSKTNSINNLKSMARPPHLAIVSMIFDENIDKKNSKFRIFEKHTHMDVLNSVLSQEVQAGLIYSKLYTNLGPKYQNKFKIIKTYPLNIAGMIVAHPKISSSKIKGLQTIFVHSVKDNESMFSKQKVLSKEELQKFNKQQERYVKKTVKILGTMPQ